MSRPVAVAPASPPREQRLAQPPPLRLVSASAELPLRVFVIAGGASISAGLAASALAWPLWSVALITLGPWIPLYLRDVAEVARRNPWLALFYVVAVSQGGHLVEHVTQMVQLHLLHLPPAHSRGIFGPLDVEWVHFGWNTFILLATASLLAAYRHSRLLLAAFALAIWHQAEHTWIMSVYLSTGDAGSAGLLAAGGVIGGGLPLKRADLHFLYNIAETTPLIVAFVIETARAKRTARLQDAARVRRLESRRSAPGTA